MMMILGLILSGCHENKGVFVEIDPLENDNQNLYSISDYFTNRDYRESVSIRRDEDYSIHVVFEDAKNKMIDLNTNELVGHIESVTVVDINNDKLVDIFLKVESPGTTPIMTSFLLTIEGDELVLKNISAFLYSHEVVIDTLDQPIDLSLDTVNEEKLNILESTKIKISELPNNEELYLYSIPINQHLMRNGDDFYLVAIHDIILAHKLIKVAEVKEQFLYSKGEWILDRRYIVDKQEELN
jgi:hypothetical protein